jgi:light-regulated signal transduction histidine kinase (bacteriophytochrome)
VIELLLAGLLLAMAGALVAFFRAARAERARHEAQIRELSAALARREADIASVNKELETFAYSISHDLRAPLRHIGGYSQLLAQSLEDRLEDEPRRFLNVIGQASRQMGQLIDDLLSFSRLTRADLNRGRVAPRDIVDAVIAGLTTETRGRDIEWRIGELPLVEADPAMLKTVYANLIGNAVKYTAPRDRAIIESGADAAVDGRVPLFVRDNGVGFDMAYADRLFGIFQRLHPPEEFDGTGIGLATVQRIIARHGGRVWAQAAPGAGATFYFTLAEPARSERSE